MLPLFQKSSLGGFLRSPLGSRNRPQNGFLWQVSYTWVTDGFSLSTRLLKRDSAARDSELMYNESVIGEVPEGFSDYLDANQGYQLRITVLEDSLPISLNGNTEILVPLVMVDNSYLGTESTNYYWTTYYTEALVGAKTYNVLVELLRLDETAIHVRLANGHMTEDYVQEQFSITTPYLGADYEDGEPLFKDMPEYHFSVYTLARSASDHNLPAAAWGWIGQYRPLENYAGGGPTLSHEPENTANTIYSFNANLTGTHSDNYPIGGQIVDQEYLSEGIQPDYVFAIGGLPNPVLDEAAPGNLVFVRGQPVFFLSTFVRYLAGYGPTITVSELSDMADSLPVN